MISLIAARSKNNVIGKNGRLPWRLPADMEWFKRHTLDETIIMGRKTWDSLPIKPLPNRSNVIITRGVLVDDSTYAHPVVDNALIGQLDEVLSYYEDFSAMIIGGASIYKQSLPSVLRMYLTEVQTEIVGDDLTYFPAFDETEWRETFKESHAADEKNEFGMVFRILERACN